MTDPCGTSPHEKPPHRNWHRAEWGPLRRAPPAPAARGLRASETVTGERGPVGGLLEGTGGGRLPGEVPPDGGQLLIAGGVAGGYGPAQGAEFRGQLASGRA